MTRRAVLKVLRKASYSAVPWLSRPDTGTPAVRPAVIRWSRWSRWCHGCFTVQMSLSWHVTSTGLTLGARSVTYNGNDYSCNAAVACSASASGYVYLG